MGVVVGSALGERDASRRYQVLTDRLAELAGELAKRGLATRLLSPAGRVPNLRVLNPAAPRLAEDIYVGCGQDGLWWFWWPWAERIAQVDELDRAAGMIAKVLSATG